MRVFAAGVLAVVVAITVSITANAASLTIPSTHPRLWYGNATRLQQARTYFAGHPISPGATDYYAKALKSVIDGTPTDANCTAAAHYFRDWTTTPGSLGTFRDDVRQQGEDLLLMFDWCQAALTPSEISTLVTRWNTYMDTGLADDLGNAGKEANNYWSGYTRNLLMWGIASYGVNAKAQTYIDIALDTRMGHDFPIWYQNFGRGGVFPEGGDYGIVSLSYPLIPFASAVDFGFDPYAHTAYFREAIYALIYGTTPGPSTITNEFANAYSYFPFNDDEKFLDGGTINLRNYPGDFAAFMGAYQPALGNAAHARAWATASSAGRRSIFAALGGGGAPTDLSSLPLDYFAPGAAYFDMRTAHDANAMQVHLQLGEPGGIEHRHLDAGSFQVWRKGRWLTRESTGYSDFYVGYHGGAQIDSLESEAHNTLLFEGRTTGIWVGSSGPVPNPNDDDLPRGLPVVKRLQHEADFAFSATDYADAYRHRVDTRVDWPYADKAVREFLFIRPLQALVILDRTRGSADSMRPFYATSNWLEDGPNETGDQVRRGFIMHFETQPTVAAPNRLEAPLGTQKSELITLLPANAYAATSPDVRIVNEDRPGDEREGQYRLELDSVGALESYFINVVSGYDNTEAPLAATLQDAGDHWVIALSHPTRGTATVILNKGMVSSGGSVKIGNGATVPLASTVQTLRVTDSGPVWDTDSIFKNGFDL